MSHDHWYGTKLLFNTGIVESEISWDVTQKTRRREQMKYTMLVNCPFTNSGTLRIMHPLPKLGSGGMEAEIFCH